MSAKVMLRPLGLSGPGEAAAGARSLAGGPLFFSRVEVLLRPEDGQLVRSIQTLESLDVWAATHGQAEAVSARLAALTRPALPFAGVATSAPSIMGILNITPDSFSDGGDRFDPSRAVADGLAMWQAGAQFLDIGGESTRPGAQLVGIAEELDRVLPVVSELAKAGARVSIDSRHAAVMEAALEAGAQVINDVTALTGDPQSLPLAAKCKAPVVLMHMLGEPCSMQINPRYDDVAYDIFDYLEARIASVTAAGLPKDAVAVDTGIGFGKTLAHNLRLLEQLALFQGLGCPLLLGASRKSFIGRLSRDEPPKERLPGSLAAVLIGVARGCQIFRVHDAVETSQALKLWQAVAESGRLER